MKNRRKVEKINIKQANKNWFNKNEIKLVNLIKIAGKKELCIITILQPFILVQTIPHPPSTNAFHKHQHHHRHQHNINNIIKMV